MKSIFAGAVALAIAATGLRAETVTIDFEADVFAVSRLITTPLGSSVSGFLTYDTAAAAIPTTFETRYDALTAFSVTLPTSSPTTFTFTGSELFPIALVNDLATVAFPTSSTTGVPAFGDQVRVNASRGFTTDLGLNLFATTLAPDLPAFLASEDLTDLQGVLNTTDWATFVDAPDRTAFRGASLSFVDESDLLGPDCSRLGCQIQARITRFTLREPPPPMPVIPLPAPALLLLGALGGLGAVRRMRGGRG